MARRPRRFDRSTCCGRCRRNLLTGLVLMAIGIAYGSWGARQFGQRGADDRAFDRPVVRAARRMVPPPTHLKDMWPQNDRELYLTAVISDQQDVMLGLMLFILRMIASLTAGGLGLVLVTAGATEWEVRSEGVSSDYNVPPGG
jgi:hypothetical protein